MTLEQRVEILEKYQAAIIKTITNNKQYDEADKAGLRQAISNEGGNIEQNRADIDFIAMEAGIDLEEGK